MAVSVPIMVHNRYFFANGRKDKSIYFKAEYLATDSGNGRNLKIRLVTVIFGVICRNKNSCCVYVVERRFKKQGRL